MANITKIPLDLEQFNILELLGVMNMAEDKQSELVLGIVRVGLERALEDLHTSGKITEQELDQINALAQQSVSSEALQSYIMTKYPDISDFIRLEINEIKLAAIKDNLNKFLAYISENSMHLTEYERLVLDSLNRSIDESRQIEFNLFISQFAKLREKYNFSK